MDTVTIGGILYRKLRESTLEQDAAILKILDEQDLRVLQMADGEKAEAFALRIITDLILSGKAFPILGCFLVPDGVKWTQEVAKETAERLREITDPEDKNKIRNALVPFLHDFFCAGLISVVISRRFSALLRGIVGRPQKTADPLTLGSGRRSFGSWLAGILTGRSRLRAGLSAKPS